MRTGTRGGIVCGMWRWEETQVLLNQPIIQVYSAFPLFADELFQCV